MEQLNTDSLLETESNRLPELHDAADRGATSCDAAGRVAE